VEFNPTMEALMAGANGEANRVLKTRKALDEVKGQMMDNIEKVTAHSHTSERGGGTQACGRPLTVCASLFGD